MISHSENGIMLKSEWDETLSKVELSVGLFATLVLIAVHGSVLMQQCAARMSEVPLELGSPVNPRKSLSLFAAEGWCPVISRNQAIATK